MYVCTHALVVVDPELSFASRPPVAVMRKLDRPSSARDTLCVRVCVSTQLGTNVSESTPSVVA